MLTYADVCRRMLTYAGIQVWPTYPPYRRRSYDGDGGDNVAALPAGAGGAQEHPPSERDTPLGIEPMRPADESAKSDAIAATDAGKEGQQKENVWGGAELLHRSRLCVKRAIEEVGLAGTPRVCVLMLLYMCVLMLLYMCPHAAICVSSCCYICVLMLLCVCLRTAVCASPQAVLRCRKRYSTMSTNIWYS